MTPNQAKIVLTNPCSENWNSMQVDTIGRFCQSCQKSVIDFTSKSDNEIRSFLKDKQGEKLCGRFHAHQVERIRIEIDRNILVSDIPFWQKFLVVLLVCFGPDFLGADFVFAQTDSIPVKMEQLDSVPVSEPDSTLEVTVDSAIIEPFEGKTDTRKLSCDPKLITTIGFVMGDISIVYKPQDFPEPKIRLPMLSYQPEKNAVPKTGIAQLPKNNPETPGHPEKKSSPPENAVIADNEVRRKTRRS
ncbi:MAG: hypothetical protein K0S23_2468 [Fluviicola sp.]|jgi:hypothetical protein|uniref:hypothetical protein n=1 Tax=Fluviicola sp. TaxID=1917219 RepID=UPI00262ED951|nr:hypothetical protein [Fluviicola sp.]MDF3028161.1 hypothetical protein [Fluviicola sp.]